MTARIFKFDVGIDEYIAAEDYDSAKECLDKFIDYDEEEDFNGCEELTDEQIDDFLFTEEDGSQTTFRAKLNERVANGEALPFTFASSEW